MKQKTIKRRIFFSYAVLFLSVLTVFLVCANLYMGVVLKNNAVETLNQFGYTISEQMDTECEALYNFSVNTSTSTSLRSYFFETYNDKIALRINERYITDLVLSIAGPMYRFHRLILVREDGLTYEYSSREIEFDMDVEEDYTPFEEVIEKKGAPLFRGTYTDQSTRLFKDFPVISVSFAFSEVFGNQYTNIIEAQQSYEVYESIINTSISSARDSGLNYQIYVFDGDGGLIYPYNTNRYDVDRAEYFWNQSKESQNIFEDYNSGDKLVGEVYQSELTEWTTLVLVDYKELMKPIYNFISFSTVLMVLLLIVLLIISYSISRSITIPLQKIQTSIKDYNLNRVQSVQPLDAGHELDELTALSNTFQDMQERINEYVQELIAVKTHDLQSQFSALQSQMNPHFIYNSIALISIMCEEDNNEEAIVFCKGLTNMLRYSSSNYLREVTLKEEVEYAKTYLELLQKRYEGLLDIDVILPAMLYEKSIPKLIIQPIAENCIKYGLESNPPWFIGIEVEALSNGWQLIVSDTGNGFDADTLTSIRSQIESIDFDSGIPALVPDGMGIINVYIRLKMYYRELLEFEIGNQDEGGAFVLIKVIDKETYE